MFLVCIKRERIRKYRLLLQELAVEPRTMFNSRAAYRLPSEAIMDKRVSGLVDTLPIESVGRGLA